MAQLKDSIGDVHNPQAPLLADQHEARLRAEMAGCSPRLHREILDALAEMRRLEAFKRSRVAFAARRGSAMWVGPGGALHEEVARGAVSSPGGEARFAVFVTLMSLRDGSMSAVLADEMGDGPGTPYRRAEHLMREPVAVEELREAGEDGGGFMGYFCRGFPDVRSFANACNDAQVENGRWEPIREEDVARGHWRAVPISGQSGQFQYVPAHPGSKGSFAVTHVDVGAADTKRLWRWHARGYRSGFGDGAQGSLGVACAFLDEKGHAALAPLLMQYWREGARTELERKMERDLAP